MKVKDLFGFVSLQHQGRIRTPAAHESIRFRLVCYSERSSRMWQVFVLLAADGLIVPAPGNRAHTHMAPARLVA
jgi:hypothetical protein